MIASTDKEVPSFITEEQLQEAINQAAICPRCGKKAFGLFQDDYCANCAYTGEDRIAKGGG